jgi:hypothetical protein
LLGAKWQVKMITIFNKKQGFEISIDDLFPQVTFTPRDYEDIPFVQIELRGINFHHHSQTCKDCKAFIASFGTNTLDWFISYSGKRKRLDLSNFSGKYFDNHSTYKVSEFDNSSTLKLNLNKLPDSKEELEILLKEDIKSERYERCCIWRNLLNEY